MVKITLGIIGGGQLGSMLSSAAKKLNLKQKLFQRIEHLKECIIMPKKLKKIMWEL